MNEQNATLDIIRQANDDFIKNFEVSNIDIVDHNDDFTPDQLYEIIQKIHTFDSFDIYNDPFGIHNSGSFQFGDLEVVFGIRFYDENQDTYYYPDSYDSTGIINIHLSEYKEIIYSKQYFQKIPILFLLTNKLVEAE
ncbi:MAG: DUF3768 domain-containing protein [Candidatus Gracilibacteria bacterium]|nr:DUF3768 domain-containing protein [Candidatus Gracilibacteria bacterium]